MAEKRMRGFFYNQSDFSHRTAASSTTFYSKTPKSAGLSVDHILDVNEPKCAVGLSESLRWMQKRLA
eukprot:gene28322-31438_t